MPESKDLTGCVFGKWNVIEKANSVRRKDGRIMRYWLCECSCDKHTTRIVLERSLLNNKSTSCGCSRRETSKKKKINSTHCMSTSRLYSIYNHMCNRCNNRNDINYKNYGGRGITVCNEWNEFEPFYEWAKQSGYSDELTIDRIDVNKGYSPDNCRWSDQKTQANNKTNNRNYTYCGETHTIAEWSRIYEMDYKLLWRRLYNGWSIQSALLTEHY